jgi:type I restriction enzyme S subunit
MIANSLYAIISLPGGVFLPYADAKTDIILLDAELAKQRDEILFVKIKNDGYSLTQTRSPQKGSQLPQAFIDVENFKKGINTLSDISFTIKKEKILADKDCDLTGERYRQTTDETNNLSPIEKLIVEQSERVKNNSAIPVWSVSNKEGFIDPEKQFSKRVASEDTSNYKIIRKNYFAYNPARINVGSIALNSTENIGCVSPMYVVFNVDETQILPKYLFLLLKTDAVHKEIVRLSQGTVRSQLRFKDLQQINIPLPNIETQKDIVNKIDKYKLQIEEAQQAINEIEKQIEF